MVLMWCCTLTLWDLTRCMLSAGVLGRIFPHPSTVQRMLVRTSLVSSVMEGLIISLSCKGSFSLHFCLLWRLSFLTVEAAMIQHTTTHTFISGTRRIATNSPQTVRTFTSGRCIENKHMQLNANVALGVHYFYYYFLYNISNCLQTNAPRLHFRVLFALSKELWRGVCRVKKQSWSQLLWLHSCLTCHLWGPYLA